MNTRPARPTRSGYPFAAVAGQTRLKAALLACAVDPAIGGVLVRGEKGTGKTTLVRGLAELLPPIRAVKGCPYRCDPEDETTPHLECAERIRAARAGGAPGGDATDAGAARAGAAEAGGTDAAAGADAAVATGAGSGPEEIELPVPVAELPLGATEERVAGAIDLEETLRRGERRFEPGILAAANRGILYIDEVNLLEDHLVDLILDAAATGVNRVEREGFSLEHPARFIPVGTMNPEEGELRPQFLDRFGLCISIRGEEDPETRKLIVRRRMDYDTEPAGFAARWQGEQRRLLERVAAARRLLPEVELAEELRDLIAALACEAQVQGHRADLVMSRTAIALAALGGRGEVRKEHVLEAARLALPHRISGAVDATPESEAERLEQLIAGFDAQTLAQAQEAARERARRGERRKEISPARNQESAEREDAGLAEAEEGAAGQATGAAEAYGEGLEELQVPGSAAAGSIVFDFLEKKSPR
jgi:Mg-chelatase subunit ChlI